ncbi:MAG: UDP-N-acetylmuramoyl-L-alanyl-D-glutamate--2,6-diaminopimelate ligase [Patescibacteria group bacterium]|nr:UDP-N-acetylmuramoyl-L-alanyl-D-glutamate--2,6-diaminopimelate ligase [Patescibacteria group bacterium]MDD5490689.1 UDP-N-acetylmuramoyl-L-alanyl-D-glutamate--2,6-diaminopimelate ligase [Patescibacteria group bacterium]
MRLNDNLYLMKEFIKKFIPKFVLAFYYKSLAVMADIFYGHPSGKMVVIGVTGTNGKSTTVNLIGRILEEAGYKVGWTSTANFKIAEKEWLNDTKMTMLGRFKLQKLLKDMVRAGCEYAIVETSSEGIKQFRHFGINYDVAVFTNLTPEHLESHGGFENYKKAKMELFRHTARGTIKKVYLKNKPVNIKKTSVVNIDDEYFLDFLRFETDEAWGYGIEGRGGANISRIVQAEKILLNQGGVSFEVKGTVFNLKLLGEFNIYNSLAAIAVALSQDIDLETCRRALEKIPGLPGRMEFIEEGQPFRVLVDYAPEPASFAKMYEALKSSGIKNSARKVIHVLGSCGGGRDRNRRPILGSLAAKEANIVIVTNEDPYDDIPSLIIDEVAEGAIKEGKILAKNLFKIEDRGEAIKKAMELAEAGDLVVITGKGAEQAIAVAKGKKIPWDDRIKAREAIKQKLQISNDK